MASSTTSRRTRSRKSGNDGATVRNQRAAAPAASTATEDVGDSRKHDKRVDQLMTAVRKETKLPVGLKDSTMANRLILTIAGATAAWLWLSRGQLNAASSRTGLDIKGVGVNVPLGTAAKEIVKRNTASPGRGAGASKTPPKATTARKASGSKTSGRKRGSGGKAPATGGDLTSQLQETVRRTRQSGSTSGGSRQRRRSR